MTPIDEAVRVRELLHKYNDPDWQAGSAEPWIAELLAALVIACDAHTAIEIGGFQGYTSARIASALAWLPHDTTFTVCEIDAERAQLTQNVLAERDQSRVRCNVVLEDSLKWIPTLPNESVDFGWLDGNHEQAHVTREIELLWPKLRNKGILAFHDVYGVCRLSEVVEAFKGYALDLPRAGPAGGIGLLQKRL